MRGLLRAVRTATRGQVVGRAPSPPPVAWAPRSRDRSEARHGGRSARGARVSSVAMSYIPSRAPDPLGGSPGFRTKGTFGVHAVRLESKICPPESFLAGKTEPVRRRRRAPASEEEARDDRGLCARANPARSWGAAANAAPVGALLGEGCCFIRLQSKNTPLGVQRD